MNYAQVEKNEVKMLHASCLFEGKNFSVIDENGGTMKGENDDDKTMNWHEMKCEHKKEAVNDRCGIDEYRSKTSMIWKIRWHAMNVCEWRYERCIWSPLEERLDGDEDACEYRGNDDRRIEDSGGQLSGPHYGVRSVTQTVADTWLVGFHAHNYRWAKSYFNWNHRLLPWHW